MSFSNTSGPPSGNLSVAIGKGTFFGVLANVVQVATRFITVPIVISHLGLGGYGIWNIIMAIAAYMRFGSAGIKCAYQKYVAEATGKANFDITNQLLSTGAAVMLGLSIVGLVPVSLFSRKLAILAGIPHEFVSSAGGAISMLAAFMVLANWGGVYEAIITGGQRIDLLRKLGTVMTIAEAVGVVVVLRLGYGLLAMAIVMAGSELIYILYCVVVSRRVVPQVRVAAAYVTKDVLPELIRFGGSYQLVNVLAVLYVAIVPITILRFFGDTASGIYALVYRVATAALMLQEAFLLPMLSSSTVVFASGIQERMRSMLTKSFKASTLLALLPIAFVGTFGTLMVTAWTGQTGPMFRGALILVCLSTLFNTYSNLQLVLYRASGNAIMDNLRQGLGILTLLIVTLFANRLGFYGVLAGLTLSNLLGVLFMFYAIETTYHCFEIRAILPDTFRIAAATLVTLSVGAATILLPLPQFHVNEVRLQAVYKLVAVTIGCLLSVLPALLVTRALTTKELKMLLQIALPRKFKLVNVSTGE